MKGDIAYTRDIVKKVSEELNISEAQVEHVIEFMIYYIKKLTLTEKIFNIYIPFLGQMYMNVGHVKGVVTRADKSTRFKNGENLEIWRQKTKDLDSALIPGMYSPHKKRSKISNHYFTGGRNLEQLEAKQNGYESET